MKKLMLIIMIFIIGCSDFPATEWGTMIWKDGTRSPAIVGACCYDVSCDIVTQAKCDTLGGVWYEEEKCKEIECH